jgi:hypothetical protein
MSEFQIDYQKVDVDSVMSQIRQRIKEKKNRLFSDSDVDNLSNIKNAMGQTSNLVNPNCLNSEEEVNLSMHDIYRSSESKKGKLIFKIRSMMRKPFKFILNIDVMVTAVARLINLHQQLIGKLKVEVVPRINDVMARTEIQKGIIEGQKQQIEYLEKRLRALEKLAVLKEDAVAAIGQTSRKSSDLESGRYKPKNEE